MRDGLPVIAFVIAVVALVVALAGVVTRGQSETPEPPEEMLKGATRQLAEVARERRIARKEFDRLSKDVVRAIEAGPAGRGGGLDLEEVRDIVGREVDDALRRRVNEEIAKAKAKAKGKAKVAVKKPGPPKAASKKAAKKAGDAAPRAAKQKKSDKSKEFDGMLAEIEKALKLDKKKAGGVRSALRDLRGELNRIFGDERDGKIKAAERDSRAGAARKRADGKLAVILGKGTFQRFTKWRVASKNAYARRFFGL